MSLIQDLIANTPSLAADIASGNYTTSTSGPDLGSTVHALVASALVNPIGVGIKKATGISEEDQFKIGAAGGLVAMTPVIGPGVQDLAGSMLATAGAGAASAGSYLSSLGGATAPSGTMAGLTSTVGEKAAQWAKDNLLTTPEPAPTPTPANTQPTASAALAQNNSSSWVGPAIAAGLVALSALS